MKSTIVCLVIAAVFVYASAMPAVGDTAAPVNPAEYETPAAATTVLPAEEAAPEAPSIPAQTPLKPIADLTEFFGKSMKAITTTLGSFGR